MPNETDRHTVTETVCQDEEGDPHWIFSHCPLGEAIEWFQEIMEEIPEEYRGAAYVNIGTTSNGDGREAFIEIRYTRPETDAEMETREQQRQDRVRLLAHRELEELKRLREKYGDVR